MPRGRHPASWGPLLLLVLGAGWLSIASSQHSTDIDEDFPTEAHGRRLAGEQTGSTSKHPESQSGRFLGAASDALLLSADALLACDPGGIAESHRLQRSLAPLLAGTPNAAAGVHWVAANAATLVPLLLAHAGLNTSQPLVICLSANVSLSSADEPPGGIPINRPLVLLGSTQRPTSIDFGMGVNLLDLTGSPHAHVTLDSLVLENLAPGDAQSAAVASGVGLSVTIRIWALRYDRSEPRLVVHDCVLVVDSITEIEYLSYWNTALNSGLPWFTQQALWVQRQVKVLHMETRLDEGQYTMTMNVTAAGLHMWNATITTLPRVATKLPLPARTFSPALIANQPAPLVELLHDIEQLPAQLTQPTLQQHRKHFVLLASNMSCGAAQPGGPAVLPDRVPLPRPVTLTSVPQELPGGQQDHGLVLDVAGRRNLLHVPADAQAGHLKLDMLQLTRLPQGPAAAHASDLVPDVWTILMWHIDRPLDVPGVVVLQNVTLHLPTLEFQHIARQAAVNSVFGLQPAGLDSDTIVIHGAHSINSTLVFLRSFNGYGLSAENLWLVPATEPLLLHSHYWPSEDRGTKSNSRLAMALAAWLVAVAKAALVLVAALAAAVFMFSQQLTQLFLFAQRLAGVRSSANRAAPALVGLPAPWREGADQLCSLLAQDSSLGCVDEQQISGSASASMLSLQWQRGQAQQQQQGEQQQSSALLDTWRQVNSAVLSLVVSLHERRGMQELPLPSLQSHNSVASRAADAAADNSAPVADSDTDAGSPVAIRTQSSSTAPLLQLYEVLGIGSFGCVYRGSWRGALVAVKVMQLPADGAMPAVVAERLQQRSAELKDAGDLPGKAEQQQQQQKEQGQQQQQQKEQQQQRSSFSTMKGEFQIVPLMQQQQVGASLYKDQQDKVAQPLLQQQQQQQRLPQQRLPQQRRQVMEQMAVKECAVASSLRHPCIVQVFTYCLRPMHAPPSDDSNRHFLSIAPPSDSGPVLGWELRLVMEYCGQGTLRAALDNQLLHDRATGRPEHVAVLMLALDVAQAMVYLHGESILHGDLKTSNVLLKQVLSEGVHAALQSDTVSSAVSGSRLQAKVADFGLSSMIDPSATHVSQVYAGTMTHMAPELLISGRSSKASDVYAYGVLLWELATAGHAFADTQRALLGHKIVHERLRPSWVGTEGPGARPFGNCGTASIDASERRLRDLAERCWAHDPSDRPTFEEVADELEALVQQLTSKASKASTAAPSQQQLALPQSQQESATEPSTLFDSQWMANAGQVVPLFGDVVLEDAADTAVVACVEAAAPEAEQDGGMVCEAPAQLCDRFAAAEVEVLEQGDGSTIRHRGFARFAAEPAASDAWIESL